MSASVAPVLVPDLRSLQTVTWDLTARRMRTPGTGADSATANGRQDVPAFPDGVSWEGGPRIADPLRYPHCSLDSRGPGPGTPAVYPGGMLPEPRWPRTLAESASRAARWESLAEVISRVDERCARRASSPFFLWIFGLFADPRSVSSRSVAYRHF